VGVTKNGEKKKGEKFKIKSSPCLICDCLCGGHKEKSIKKKVMEKMERETGERSLGRND
jgi:hypothetical protein